MRSALSLAIAASCVGRALAWGAVGHETVAYVAQSYLTPTATAWVNDLLNGASMASVATWADTYRYTSAGHWSAPFHFVDAQDSPPSACNLNYQRDCSGGCIISAITN